MPTQRRTSRTPPKSNRGPYSAGPRGRACGNCRRRKVKCDGLKPTCTQCLRFPLSESAENQVCEYSDPRFRRSEEQVLKETIKTLEARIRELEMTSDISLVRLHTPYQNSEAILEPPQDQNLTDPRMCVCALTVIVLDLFSSSRTLNLYSSRLEAFFRHASEVGFFLHIPRFRHAVTLPVDSPGRPCQGLISAVLLLGFSLMEGQPSKSNGSDPYGFVDSLNDNAFTTASVSSQEALYLSRAQIDVAGILSSSHPDHIIHAIQAELLLSTYLFRQGCILEGKYHLSAATSIAFGAKLHKIRSLTGNRDILTTAALPWVVDTCSSSCWTDFHLHINPTESLLPHPADSISEGERINAFWMVITMSNCWALAADSSPNFILERYIEDIDTPWPMDIEDYEQNLSSEYLDSGTVVKLLQGEEKPMPNGNGYSTLALYAQASIFLSRAATVTLAYHPNMSSSAAAKFATAFLKLDNILSRFKSKLVPNSSSFSSSSDDIEPMRFNAHVLAHLATILLHSKVAIMVPTSNSFLNIFSIEAYDSGQKRLNAAEAIAELCRKRWLLKSDMTADGYSGLDSCLMLPTNVDPNPFLGSLWLVVGQVLIEETNLVRMILSSRTSMLNLDSSELDRREFTSERETELMDKLDCIMKSAQLSRVHHSPLANYLYNKLQNIYLGRLHCDNSDKFPKVAVIDRVGNGCRNVELP